MDGRALFGRQRLPVARLLLQAPDQVRHVGGALLEVALTLLESTDLAFPVFSPPTAEASLRVVAEARPSTVALAALAPAVAAFATSRGSGSPALTAAALAAILLFLTPVAGVASVTAAVSTIRYAQSPRSRA